VAATQQQARWPIIEGREGEDEVAIFTSFTRLEMLHLYFVEFSTSKGSFLLIKNSCK